MTRCRFVSTGSMEGRTFGEKPRSMIFFTGFGRIICVSIIRQKPAIAQKNAEIFLNTKFFSIISVCVVLNVNTDVMLENANTRKIYAVFKIPNIFEFNVSTDIDKISVQR